MTTITIERAVLLRALEALRPATAPNGAKRDAAFEDLRAALAAPATAPAQPERKPMTEECIKELYGDSNFDIVGPYVIAFVRAVEAFHGIKELAPRRVRNA